MLVASEAAKAIAELREELDDHLQAINDNTAEVELNYTYLLDMNKRLKFIESKMQVFEKILSKLTSEKICETKKAKIKISKQEQDVFMAFYHSESALTYEDICDSMGKSESFVRCFINSLIEKGVPITKHIIKRKTYFLLDPAFREMQTKQNILNIEKTLTLDCFDQSIVE
ncbi:hypothetical protein KY335_00480 [Candidatus Woesearchaeota archaeon]|nr:hypothetical protein [Candidatus Woesearchaeota archaeon]